MRDKAPQSMTGPEHYQAAEHYLTSALARQDAGEHDRAALYCQVAQVHATLAAAAASALNATKEYAPGHRAADQWNRIAWGGPR